jgi:hypothetical protein
VSADAPDLTVTITWPDRNQHRYWCRVTSRHLPPEEQSSEEWLPGDLENLIDSKLGEFVDPRVDEYGRMTSLTGAGLEFFDASPDNFKRIFWELIDRRTPPRTIYIVTQEPSLPWELMIPNREGADGYEQREPLGVEFAVGRRITQSHRSAPQHLPLKTSWVIAPRYSGNPPQLPHAEVEAQDVASRFHGMRVDPADVKRINLMLQAEPRSLVHLVCHGARGQRAGTQEIYVDGNDRVLTSTMARGMQGFRVQCQNKAVFFLNACEVGQPVPALVGAGGFARVFSEFGAGAVIAPLWSVDDAVAHEVATRFYDEIAGGADRSFAEILRDIRRQAYNETGVDTYAAYCFYGDPLARA